MIVREIFLARHGRAIVGAAFCALALLVAILSSGLDRPVRSADVLSGKWTGNILWSDASGLQYSRTMHTSLYFEPDGTVGTILTLPSGNLGGNGTYTFKDGCLTIHCTDLTINGHPLPMTLFDREPWFHETAAYNVTFNGTNLTLTNLIAKQPTEAPGYPLLNSGKPIVLSRVEKSPPAITEPAPKE